MRSASHIHFDVSERVGLMTQKRISFRDIIVKPGESEVVENKQHIKQYKSYSKDDQEKQQDYLSMQQFLKNRDDPVEGRTLEVSVGWELAGKKMQKLVVCVKVFMGSAVSCTGKTSVKMSALQTSNDNNKMEENTEVSVPQSNTPIYGEIPTSTTKLYVENDVIEIVQNTKGKQKTEIEDDKDTDTETNKTEPKSPDKEKKEEELMTDEELKEFREKTFHYLRKTANEVVALENSRSDNGEYVFKIRNATNIFMQSFFYLKRTVLQEIHKFRLYIADIMIETKFINLIFELVANTFKSGWENKDGSINDKKYIPLSDALLTLLNFSDGSDNLAVAIATEPGFIELLKKFILDIQNRHLEKVEPKVKQSEEELMEDILGLFHNMSMRETNTARLRDIDLISVLQPFLKSSNDTCAMIALTSLAGISAAEYKLMKSGELQRDWFCMDCTRQEETEIRAEEPDAEVMEVDTDDQVIQGHEFPDQSFDVPGREIQQPQQVLEESLSEPIFGIINEKECEIIACNRDIVMKLLDILRKSLSNKKRTYEGWSCKECGFSVRLLARNDANMKMLVDLGALELLVELGKTGDKAEQYESVAALWALCFDEDNQTLITGKPELGVVDLLVDLKRSDNDSIKKACNGALWTLRDALKNTVVEKYKKIGEQLASKNKRKGSAEKVKGKKTKKKVSTRGHVMISYQWADQQVLKNVRDRIKARGYKVWMDIDQMGGSTLQAMADAVEGAEVFLMCMSNKYKHSPACRAEAEYAFQTHKKILPLKMERGYIPDGWLGLILGSKLFYEFSPKYPFEDKMNALLKELDNVFLDKMKDMPDAGEVIQPVTTNLTETAAGPHASDYPDSTTAVSQTVARLSVSMATIEKVRKWTETEVKNWIEKNSLQICGISKLTGGEIALLASMRVECPEIFYKCLQDMLAVRDLLTMSKIVWALHDLSK